MRRWWVFRVLGVVAILASAGFIVFALRQREARRLAERREQRQEAFVEVAPAPIPTGIPLRGEEGTDADGAPRQWVDVKGLRSLLLNRRFAALDQAFTHFQDAFERDARFEAWPLDAANAFGSSESPIREALDEWIDASPQSFAPYLARAVCTIAVAKNQRGGALAKDTEESDFAEMNVTLQGALGDLSAARKLRPGLVTAVQQTIRIGRLLGDGALVDRSIQELDQACPGCVLHRIAVMYALLPRWGGSYSLMNAYLARLDRHANPRLELLAGYVDADLADLAEHEKDFTEALAAIDRACARGEHAPFLIARAGIRRRRGEFPEALRDVNRALELAPASAEASYERSEIFFRQKKHELAARDLLEGLRLDPTDSTGQWLYTPVLRAVSDEAWALFHEGSEVEALRLFDLAAEIAPRASELQQRRAAVLSSGPVSPRAVEELRARLESAPDDLLLHRRLDYTLARMGRYDEIVTLWTRYLARHDDARAHLERAGTYSHLKRFAERDADLAKACEGGLTEGCVQWQSYR